MDVQMTDSLPKVLYHYTSGSSLIDIIESKSIWATKIHYLNDSKEFDHSVHLAESMTWTIEQQSQSQKERQWLKIFRDGMKQVSRINVFVASFSEVGDSLGQWRGYCSKGCGFSVGFNSMLLKQHASKQGFSIRPCIYDYHVQAKVLNDLINETLPKILNDPMATDSQEVPYVTELDRFLAKFVQIAPTLKDSCFKEEREWRFISEPLPVDDSRWRMRAGKSMLIPNVPIILSSEH